MADTVALIDASASVTSSPASKKSKTSTIAKKPRVKPNHPPTSEMVNSAIKSLKERGGSSLQAIKKYMSSNYKIDAEKLAPFIKKYLRSAVTAGQLIQTKGKGASGSFKLAASSGSAGSAAKKSKASSASPKKKPKAAVKKVKSAAASPAKKKSTAKKSDKKALGAADKKKSVSASKAPKKVAAPKAAKTSKQKPTKATKSGATKPKAPKPKTASLTKKAAATGPAKKAAASKKK